MFFPCPKCRASVAITEGDFGSQIGCNACGEVVSVPNSRLASGMVLGEDFLIESEIGSGGMATIYLAQQISLHRQVALKVLHPDYASQVEQVKEFVREARSVAQLNHPGIIQIFSVGDDAGYYYFAMELVMGASIKEILAQDEKPALEWSLMVARKIAQALEHGWQRHRLVHRDIKPDNIIIRGDGAVKLADLGLAKTAEALREFGEEVEGTPQYISPEGIMGSPMDFRSDIYSLGATLYHMVTGEFPYDADTPLETARLHVEGTLIPPSERSSGVPPYVSKLIVKMMAKKPGDRFQSLGELIAALKQTTTRLRRLDGTTNSGPMTRTMKTDLNKKNKPPPPRKVVAGNVSSDRLIRVVLGGVLVVAVGLIGVLLFMASRLTIYEPPPDRESQPPPLADTALEQHQEDRFNLMKMAGLIPGMRVEYFRDANLQNLLGVGSSLDINFSSPPDDALLAGRKEDFAMRYTGQLFVPASGEYVFLGKADDGQRLYVADEKVIDAWNGPHHVISGLVTLSRGLHAFKYEYRQDKKNAFAELRWHRSGEEPQLLTSRDVFSRPACPYLLDLVLYLPFDEMREDALPCKAGFGRQAELLPNTKAQLVEDGIMGRAIEFAASKDPAMVGYQVPVQLPTNGVSMSMWLRFDEVPANLVGKDLALIRWGGATLALKLEFLNAAGGPTATFLVNGEDASVPFHVSTGKWVHLAWVYENSKGGRLQVDGTQMGSYVQPKAPLVNDQLAMFQFGSNALTIRMDELAVWLRPLSISEVSGLYNRGKGRALR